MIMYTSYICEYSVSGTLIGLVSLLSKWTSAKMCIEFVLLHTSHVVYAALHVYMSHVAYIHSYVSMFDILHAI